jgi:hypothetical protein
MVSVWVPAGRMVIVRLPGSNPPVTAAIRAEDGTIVAGGASYAVDGSGYAATLGLPIPPLG